MSLANLDDFLTLILSDQRLHARWLNTFSFLEYIGFRKIIKSQIADTLTVEVLTHAMEEGRHAIRLKKLALQMGGKEFDSYRSETLLCGERAEEYFQNLDAACAAATACPRLTYLYVTWLVEVRALAVYGSYQSALQTRGLPLPLTGLLKEEEGHLQTVERELEGEDPRFAARAQGLKDVEEELYHEYCRHLQAYLAPVHTGAHRAAADCGGSGSGSLSL